MAGSQSAPASSQQINDKNNNRQHQEKVDHAACNMQAEAENPECKNDYKDRPKHKLAFLFFVFYAADV
jgi:uncharacterized protein (DUF2147 family)